MRRLASQPRQATAPLLARSLPRAFAFPFVFAFAVAAACGVASTPATIDNTATGAGAPAGSDERSQREPGTGDARIVQRSSGGGIIELAGDHDAAAQAARREMDEHCGSDSYMITQEGEEVIGGDTHAGGGSSTPATAWRVHYACASSTP